MQPADLARFRTLSDPQMHPNGRAVAFVVSQMDVERDRYSRTVWLWDGSRAARLLEGESDKAPRWSPDGSRLAFLRADDDKIAQVAVVEFADSVAVGETAIVTDFELGVSELVWSPDGSRLAVIADEYVGPYPELSRDERAKRPKRITKRHYRHDDEGWTFDRRGHVYVVDPNQDSGPICVTPGDDDESHVAWHPNSTEVGFVSSRHPEAHLDPGGQAFRVDVGGGTPKPITDVATVSHLSFSPDGAAHVAGWPDRWAWPAAIPLHRIDERGSWIRLAPQLDRSVLAHAPKTAPVGPQWLDDGSCVTLLEDEGTIRVVRIRPDGAVSDVVGGDRAITGVTARSDGSAMAFVATTPTDPGELWWYEGGEERPLTDLNADFRATTVLVEPQPITVATGDGAEVSAWVYIPPHAEEPASVPMLLNIHGGPASQYGYGFFDEFQVYVGAGYGVVASNPRGSSGYGTDHVRAVVGTWTDPLPPDLVDLLSVPDAAAAECPQLDLDRMGVMGGSYGGLMTARITAIDHRFQSAVAERGLYSWVSFAGTSDIGSHFPQSYIRHGVTFEELWQASPLAAADRITTPTLVIHSDDDFRTPVEQGDQFFVRLLENGVETEMLRFPEESHELSRSGDPVHRIERLEAIVEWHGRYL